MQLQLCVLHHHSSSLGRQEMERRQSKSRSKPSAVTPNNPVWRAMLCAPLLKQGRGCVLTVGSVSSALATSAREAETLATAPQEGGGARCAGGAAAEQLLVCGAAEPRHL